MQYRVVSWELGYHPLNNFVFCYLKDRFIALGLRRNTFSLLTKPSLSQIASIEFGKSTE